MPKGCLRYKDVWVAPGSNLYMALTMANKDAGAKLAALLYKECEERAKALAEKGEKLSWRYYTND